MIDVKIEDANITEREISGCAHDLLFEVIVLAACVLDFVAKDDEKTYLVLKRALTDTMKLLNFGNIRGGKTG